MRFVKQGFEMLAPNNLDRTVAVDMLKHIEKIGRVCYKSEAKITPHSYSDFVRMLVRNGHEAMIEHVSITVKFICSRGTSHALVRHRLASFAQESTIYCDYNHNRFDGQIAYILPSEEMRNNKAFVDALMQAELSYRALRTMKVPTSIAREVLPNATKTELVVTANLREWRTILKLRTGKKEGRMTKELISSLLFTLQEVLPEVFEDITPEV